MSVADVLARLEARGVVLSVEDGALRYQARVGALTDELRAALRERKAEIMAHLGAAASQKNRHPDPLETVQTCKPAPEEDALTRGAQQQEMFASAFAVGLQSASPCKVPGPRTAAEVVATLPQAPCHGGCGRHTAYGWECLACRTAVGESAP